MSTLQSFGIALDAIRGNIFRSILTMLGIFIGVASFIVILAFGNGAEQQVAERIRALGSNLLMVRPGSSNAEGVRSAAGSQDTLTEEDAEAIAREVPGAIVSAPTVAGTGQIVHANRNWNTLVGGITPDYLVARDWTVSQGQAITWADQFGAAKVVLLGQTVAESLFGDLDPIGKTVRIANVPFSVIGVLQAKGGGGSVGRDQDDTALVPLSTAKVRLLGARSQIRRNSVDFILVKLAAPEGIPNARHAISLLLRQMHGTPPTAHDDFETVEPSSAMEVQAAAKRSLTVLLGAVASVSVIVGGVSIMNIMLVSVAERTREIGLRQALGARRRDVRNQFLIEAVTLCLLGGAAGILAGIGVAVLVAGWADWPITITPTSIAFSLIFSGSIGIFFGLYPAIKAAALDPIQALRVE